MRLACEGDRDDESMVVTIRWRQSGGMWDKLSKLTSRWPESLRGIFSWCE